MRTSTLPEGVAVRADGLRVSRGGTEVLRGLTFEIETGSITCLAGPSGCGKTTLMRTIVGVQAVADGRIEVLGAAAGSAELRRRIGYSAQAPAVYGDLTVMENLRYFSAVLGAPAADPERVLEEVGLGRQRDQRAGNLSGGQLSRVSLAVALLGRPEVLVLDEPTVGLDPVLREELWAIFRGLGAARGVTLLISTHVMSEAARCDRLVLMRDGEILADDTPAALLRSMRAPDLDQAFIKLVGQLRA